MASIESCINFKFMLASSMVVKEESIKSGLITEKEYDKIVNPKKMIGPQ